MLTPPTSTTPELTSYNRVTREATVDFPAPDAPTSTTKEPGSTVRSTGPTAVTAALVADDLDVGGLQQGDTGLQIEPAAILGRQHLVQGLVDGLLRLPAFCPGGRGVVRAMHRAERS